MQKYFEILWIALVCFFCISCKNRSQQTLAYDLAKEAVPSMKSECWKETRELDGVPVIDILEGLNVIPSYIGGNKNYFADVYDRVRIDTSKNTIREAVIVVMVIDTIGIVRKECIYNKSKTTYTDFEREILEAIKHLQWIPGEKNGKKVPVSTMVKFKSDYMR